MSISHQPIVVHKYGGSSVATVEKVRKVAERIIATRRQGYRVAVVVSAMGKTTNELLDLASGVSEAPPARELDMLLTAGERISTAVLAMALQDLGHDAISLTGAQCRIHTTDRHGAAKIIQVAPERVHAELEAGRIAVVAGFQGINSRHETTTLGRGGSDTTAVALAAALDAERCDIFSDVDGVYSADPRIVESARRIDKLGYEEMQSLARHGARVLNADAVEYARRKSINIYARSTFGGPNSTVILDLEEANRDSQFGVAGVTGRRDLLRLRCAEGGGPTDVLDALKTYDVLAHQTDESRVDALLSTTNVPCEEKLAETLGERFDDPVDIATDVGTVAAVGLNVGDDPDAARFARRVLERENVPSAACFTQPQALTCVVPRSKVDIGVRAIHRAFIDEPLAQSAA